METDGLGIGDASKPIEKIHPHRGWIFIYATLFVRGYAMASQSAESGAFLRKKKNASVPRMISVTPQEMG